MEILRYKSTNQRNKDGERLYIIEGEGAMHPLMDPMGLFFEDSDEDGKCIELHGRWLKIQARCPPYPKPQSAVWFVAFGICFVAIVCVWVVVLFDLFGLFQPAPTTIQTQAHRLTEVEWCRVIGEELNMEIEVRHPAINLRADLLDDKYVIEVDWFDKYAECYGQSILYAHYWNKKPVMLFLVEGQLSPTQQRNLQDKHMALANASDVKPAVWLYYCDEHKLELMNQ